jgi:hypothetical protein
MLPYLSLFFNYCMFFMFGNVAKKHHDHKGVDLQLHVFIVYLNLRSVALEVYFITKEPV